MTLSTILSCYFYKKLTANCDGIVYSSQESVGGGRCGVNVWRIFGSVISGGPRAYIGRVTVMEEIVLSCWVNIVCFCNCKLIFQRFVFKRPEEDAGAVNETTGETDYKTSQRFGEHIRKAKTMHPAISPRRKHFNNNDNVFLVLLFVNRSV